MSTSDTTSKPVACIYCGLPIVGIMVMIRIGEYAHWNCYMKKNRR